MQINLHKGQMKVFESPARFKVVTPGRRWGKTTFAKLWLEIQAARETCPFGTSLLDSPVAYVAPSNKLAMQLMWRPLKNELKDLQMLANDYKKDQIFELVNGRQIILSGADNVDSLRGYSLGALCVDECKDVKREMFEDVLTPAMADKIAPGLFIGTPPEGKSGIFYEMQQMGFSDDPKFSDWESFEGSSWDNPYLNRAELQRMKDTMHPHVYRKEILGEFCSMSGDYFSAENFEIVEKSTVPDMCNIYITVDIAGFGTGKDARRRDDTAIAVVAIAPDGVWYVLAIHSGQWDPRETAVRIMQAYKSFEPIKLGIEKGTTKNAVGPYLSDVMHRYRRYFEVTPLSTGNKNKQDRIVWALQGRTHAKRIKLVRGDWNQKLISQACDFPDPNSHDDLLDALAYVDQMSGGANYFDMESLGYHDTWQPLDAYAGY